MDASEILEQVAWKLQAHPIGRDFSEGFKRAAKTLREKVDREKGDTEHGKGKESIPEDAIGRIMEGGSENAVD